MCGLAPLALAAFFALASLSSAFGSDSLPYSNRTHAYSGWQSTVRGDDEVVGMAGAMTAVSDGWTASSNNPAGLAMTMDNWGLHLGGNSVNDGYLQDYNQPIQTSDFGMTANPYPWGFALGWWTPSDEGQQYQLPGFPNPVQTEVEVREYKASVARLFCRDEISVGGSLILGQASETLDPLNDNPSTTRHAYGLTGNLGVMLQLHQGWLLGLTYTLPQTYHGDSTATTPGVNHFFQDVESPYRMGLGTGWFPNRLFHFGAQLMFIGPIQNAALVSDDTRLEGGRLTAVPAAGANYRFMEFKNFRGDASLGSYFEWSRIDGASSRLHLTFAIDGHFWFVNMGVGSDKSASYSNNQVSIGIDIVRLGRTLEIIPPERKLPYGGWFSYPFERSTEGLPRAMNPSWKEEPEKKNPIQIGTEVPDRLKTQLNNAARSLNQLLTVPAAPPSPVPGK